MSRLLVYFVAATALCVGPGSRRPVTDRPDPTPAGGAPPRIVDERIDDYEEDGGTKVVAEVRTTLRSSGERGWIQMRALAQGDRVTPAVGLRGVWGHNRHTAEEMEALVRRGELHFAIEGPDGTRDGRVRVARRDRLAERRIWENGTVDHFGRTAARYVVELAFDGELSPGVSRATLYVKGHPRLRAVVEVGGGVDGDRIHVVEGLDTPLATEVQGW